MIILLGLLVNYNEDAMIINQMYIYYVGAQKCAEKYNYGYIDR